MTNHVDLPNSELHEPKGFKPLTGGAADIGKVAVSKGDGTSEVRKLKASEIEELSIPLLSGTFFNDNMATATVTVQVEGKSNFLIGAAPAQVLQVRLPSPATYINDPITLKRLDANHGDGSEVKFIPNAAETIEGAAELAITVQNTSITVVSDGTNWHITQDLYPEKPLFGFWDYNDLATQGTPLNVVANTPLALTNDGLGAFTNKTYRPDGLTEIWDTVGQSFDWTELALGDTVDIRGDATVTTTTANQRVQIYLELAQGGSVYNIPFIDQIVKTASTIRATRFNSIYMGDDNTRLNGAQFIIVSDAAATVSVNGWYVRVLGTKSTY